MIELVVKAYLYALVFLSLPWLVWYAAGRWVFHRRTLSQRALLRNFVQLLTGAVFLPLYLYGVLGAWTAFTAAWVSLLAGFYAVTYLTRARPSSTNKHG